MNQMYNIGNVYVAEGFADDCDELMHRCQNEENLTFEAFCVIWQEMQMGSLFHGRTSGAEIAELSEEVLHVAKRYMVSNTNSIEETIAGLFLVYALQNLQPFTGFAALRIVPEDLPAIEHLELVARKERRLDVLYILAAVLIQGPVQYHVTLRERGMEFPIRKYLEGYSDLENVGQRPKGVFYRHNEEMSLIREMVSLSEKYAAAKAELDPRKKDPSLNYVKENLGKDLDASMKKLISGLIDTNQNEDEDDSSDDERDRVKKIKAKAMKSKVNPMQHLLRAQDKSPKKTSPRNNASPTLSSPKGKIKSTSPLKPATSSPKSVKRKRNPKKSPTQNTLTELPDLNSFNDIDLPEFEKEDNSEMNTQKNTDSKNSEEQEVDIEIDSLPCFLRSENNGKVVEIEIIDNKTEKSKKRKAIPKNSDVPTKKTKPNNSDNAKAKRKHIKNRERDDKAYIFFAKKEKKDLKKIGLKSKFKRLGISNVADFAPETSINYLDNDDVTETPIIEPQTDETDTKISTVPTNDANDFPSSTIESSDELEEIAGPTESIASEEAKDVAET